MKTKGYDIMILAIMRVRSFGLLKLAVQRRNNVGRTASNSSVLPL